MTSPKHNIRSECTIEPQELSISIFATNEDAERGVLASIESKSESCFEKERQDIIAGGRNCGGCGKKEYEEGFPNDNFSISRESRRGTRETAGSSKTSLSMGNEAPPTRSNIEHSILNNGRDRFINRSYDTYPQGTPRLAAFQSSSPSFAIWRRFSRLHCRLLQRLQNQITDLEAQLDHLDEADSGTNMEYRLTRNDWHEGWDRTQEDLLEELHSKVVEYDNLLIRDSQLRSLPPTSERAHRSLFNWIFGTKPLDAGHYEFIFNHNDFVSSSLENKDGIDELIESCLSRWPNSPLGKYILGDIESPKDPHTHFFPRHRIILVTKLVALCIALTTMLIPVLLFAMVELTRKTMSIVILIFILTFAAVMSLLAKAKTETICIGICTYAAVLVTFLGNIQFG